MSSPQQSLQDGMGQLSQILFVIPEGAVYSLPAFGVSHKLHLINYISRLAHIHRVSKQRSFKRLELICYILVVTVSANPILICHDSHCQLRRYRAVNFPVKFYRKFESNRFQESNSEILTGLDNLLQLEVTHRRQKTITF